MTYLRVRKREQAAVSAMGSRARYDYAVKCIVEAGAAWLYDPRDDESSGLVVWPAECYWADVASRWPAARFVELDALMTLLRDGRRPVRVFPTASCAGETADSVALAAALAVYAAEWFAEEL